MPHLALALVLLLSTAPATRSKPPPPPATPLSFPEMLEPTPRALVPTPKLRSLDGQRVRLVGFMADLEKPLAGGFFLAGRPASCDEAADGLADLPPDAVFVVMPSHAGIEVPHDPRLLEVTGRLELGPREEADGRVTRIRLYLEAPAPVRALRTPGTAARSHRRTVSPVSTDSKEKP